MSVVIKLPPGIRGFEEDKDLAKKIRDEKLLPALTNKKSVVLDFSDIKYSTQSFIHALLGAVLHQYKEPVLDRIEFKNCAPQIKSLVRLVVDYSLGGFERPAQTGEVDTHRSHAPTQTARKKAITHETTTGSRRSGK